MNATGLRQPITVFDIDGVLADVRHRLHFLLPRPKQWDAFFAEAAHDAVLQPGVHAVTEAAMRGSVCYLTGRPERIRDLTEQWLVAHHFPVAPLHMRANHDRRPGARVKSDVLWRLGGPPAVTCMYDDDKAVIDLLTAEGFEAKYVSWMQQPASAQVELFDAQESDGRT